MIKITSPAFAEGAIIPRKYTCSGENINPPLTFENVPENTESLVLFVDDPDSPEGTFTHWTLWNMNSKTREIKENSIPEGAVSGINGFGNTKYQGPCPSSGTHRYFFTIFSLDNYIDIKSGSGKKDIEKAMHHHIIGQGQLMAKYAK